MVQSPAPAAEPAQHHALRPDVVEHRPDVVEKVLGGHLLRTSRPVGPSVAARVDRHHPEVSGQERDLGLPGPGVHDGVRHDQADRDVAVAVHRVADAEAVALEHPALDGGSGPHQTSSPSIAAARSAPPDSTGREATSLPTCLTIASASQSGSLTSSYPRAPAGAVALEAVVYVDVLLEVVAQRNVEERHAGRGELHRRGQPALDDGDIGRGHAQVEVGHEAAQVDTLDGRQGRPGRSGGR